MVVEPTHAQNCIFRSPKHVSRETTRDCPLQGHASSNYGSNYGSNHGSGHGKTTAATCRPGSVEIRQPAGAATRRSDSRSPSGGRLTKRIPAGRKNPSAHLTVSSGGPKARADTTSYAPAWVGERSKSSASSPVTETRPRIPSAETARRRKSVRLARRSTRST